MPPQPLVKPRRCNNVTHDSEKQVHKTLKELFEYSRVCGNNTGDPPTTPGGMTVCPVTTGTTLSMLDAVKIVGRHLPQFFPTTDENEAVRTMCGNYTTQKHPEALCPRRSVDIKRTQKGREECHVLRDHDYSG